MDHGGASVPSNTNCVRYTINLVLYGSQFNMVADNASLPLQQYSTWSDVVNAALPDWPVNCTDQNGMYYYGDSNVPVPPVLPAGFPSDLFTSYSFTSRTSAPYRASYKDSSSRIVYNYLVDSEKITLYSYSFPPYTATYAPLLGGYTTSPSAWNADPDLSLTPDTRSASNTYYSILL